MRYFPKKIIIRLKILMEGLFIELYRISKNVFNGDCWAQLSVWEMSWHFQTPPTFSPHYKFEWKKWKLSSLLFFQIYFWQSSIWKGECKKCNGFDGFHLIGYRKNLIQKIGQEMVDWLEANQRTVKKWTRSELNELIEKYK